MERQLTSDAYGHILTNIGCWTADSEWIVYDTRSDPAGSRFDGRWIERVHVATGRVERVYESQHGAYCGVVTCCPVSHRAVFILGPEHPTEDWQYSACHRRGLILDLATRQTLPLDAMCLSAPLIAGALRGGSHVHTFDGRGQLVAFTYEDHLLTAAAAAGRAVERNQRSIGLSTPVRAVEVHAGHPRNHPGSHFSLLLTRTWDAPVPGSDQIQRAYEDAWVGRSGYRLPISSKTQLSSNTQAGTSEAHSVQPAVAFLGDVITETGDVLTELFLVDVPADLTQAGEHGPLEGTLSSRPRPPRGARQRRLTFTADRAYPGVAGPRHWPRSLPDGSLIFFLMRDSTGVPQFWSIAPTGGAPRQLTHLSGGVSSAFSVSYDGQWLAHTASGCVCRTSTTTGHTQFLTTPTDPLFAPRPEACVLAPHDQRIAYIRPVALGDQLWNQVFVIDP
jgi:hypothetical protein